MLTGGILSGRQVVVTRIRNLKVSTPGWRSMVVDMTSISGRDKKWIMDRFALSVQRIAVTLL